MSTALLAALPMTLLWPYWRQALPTHLANHLISAIYEFPSDEMPRCEQFVHHTDTMKLSRPMACQVNPAQLMV
jgi:hypothetical protein